jgi:hypothetical protein
MWWSRERRKDAKGRANEIKQAEEFNIEDAILRSAFPEYDPKSLIQTGHPFLLSATTPDGTRWRARIDHIYGIKDVAIFSRIIFEPHDCRGRKFYADKATGKVVVNPQEMEGLRVATTDEIQRDIPNIRHSKNYLMNSLFAIMWMGHINRHLQFLNDTRAKLANTNNIRDEPMRGYHYTPALKAYVPSDVAQVLNKDSFLSGLEWPDIHEYYA